MNRKAEIVGSLDRRIELQQPSIQRGAAGSELEVFTTEATVWANMRLNRLRGSEDFEAARQSPVSSYEFTIRYRATVTERTRIQYDGQLFDIESIDPRPDLGRKRYLTLVTQKAEL